jgi:two-component system, sensor histidine kinase and response regulator
VESTPAKGSTFFFTAHFEIDPAHAEVHANSTPDLGGMRILLTDDNQTSREIVSALLTRQGATVAQSASAQESLALLRSANNSAGPYSLMLVDQRMPGMDGLEMMQMLQRHAWRLPPAILMVNSTAFSADRARMQELGLQHYIFKPLRRHDLFAMISEVAGSRQYSAPAKDRPVLSASLRPQVDSRALRILLADDSPDNRLIVRAFLKKTSFEIDEAENGERVIAKIKTNSYDLILMDIQMPILDGFAATRAIREWERAHGLPPVPIIALTASALDEDVARAREAGCNLHVSKPIKKKTLLTAIASLTSDDELANPVSMIAL